MSGFFGGGAVGTAPAVGTQDMASNPVTNIGSDQTDFTAGGDIDFGSGRGVFWSSGANASTANDTGLFRDSAAQLRVSDAAAGLGGLRENFLRLDGAGCFLESADGVAAAVSPAGSGRWKYNNAALAFQVSVNGGAYVSLATAGATTLQGAYDAGQVISEAAGLGPVAISNSGANNSALLTLNKSPAAAQSGEALTVTMGANTTADAILVTQNGTGDAIEVAAGTVRLSQAATQTVLKAGGDLAVTVVGANNLTLGTTNLERARITSGGAFLVGSTAQVGTETVRLTGRTLVDATSTTAFTVVRAGGGVNDASMIVDTSSDPTAVIVYLGNGSASGGVTGNGTIRGTNGVGAVVGGSVLFLGGDSSGTTGGQAIILGGNGGASGAGGLVTVQGGTGGGIGALGGGLDLLGGNGNNGFAGGPVLVRGGTGSGSPGGSTTVRGGNGAVGIAGGVCRIAGGFAGDAATAGGELRFGVSVAGSGTSTTDVMTFNTSSQGCVLVGTTSLPSGTPKLLVAGTTSGNRLLHLRMAGGETSSSVVRFTNSSDSKFMELGADGQVAFGNGVSTSSSSQIVGERTTSSGFKDRIFRARIFRGGATTVANGTDVRGCDLESIPNGSASSDGTLIIGDGSPAGRYVAGFLKTLHQATGAHTGDLGAVQAFAGGDAGGTLGTVTVCYGVAGHVGYTTNASGSGIITTGAALLAAVPQNTSATRTIVTSAGVLVRNQGATGVTTAVGVEILAQSGAATNNLGIRSAAGNQNRLVGATVIGADAAPIGAEILRVAGQTRLEDNVTIAGDRQVTPVTDNQCELGTDANRWKRVRAVEIVSGDLGFDDDVCFDCGGRLEVGDELVFRATRRSGNALMTVPIHLECSRRRNRRPHA